MSAALPGRVVTKTRFDKRRPTPYVAPNKPHFNLHDSIAAGRGGGVRVHTEHMYANANYGFADPNDPAKAPAGLRLAGTTRSTSTRSLSSSR